METVSATFPRPVGRGLKPALLVFGEPDVDTIFTMRSAVIALFLTIPFAMNLFAADNGYTQEVRKWQDERLKNLKKDDGWPTLAGLFWLKEGSNPVGRDESLPVVLPAPAPPAAGTLTLTNGKVQFTPNPAAAITLEGKPLAGPVTMISDADPKQKPTTLRIGAISFFVIQRGERIGVRVRDNNSPARKQLASLEYYPIDPAWRLEATFEAYKPPKKIPIVNILGMVEPTDSVGALVFKIKGTTYRLDVLEEDGEKEGEKVFFVIFADKTNGKETYGSGRYLYTSTPDKNGKVILDFNEAYSPPCAFTSYATCPLPPKQNKLPIEVTAGEKHHKANT